MAYGVGAVSARAAPTRRGGFANGRRVAAKTARAGCGTAAAAITTAQNEGAAAKRYDAERTVLRLGIPSKGRMAEDTLDLLSSCQLNVRKVNPRQYIARMPRMEGMEVWFQRATDVVRKMRQGDIDLGIVGFDMLSELGEGDEDLIVLHEALDFGQCHLAVAIPQIWGDITSLEQLRNMGWTAEKPLRIVTGYLYIAQDFFTKNGFEHFELSTADGALEAAPAMGTADVILDLVSSGTTLRENNLKEIEGGKIMESEGVFVASKKALLNRPGALEVVHEMIERFDSHLRAEGLYTVTANMRGGSMEEVASKIAEVGGPELSGLQGPTVSKVFTPMADGTISDGEYYAVNLCVKKGNLYDTVKTLRTLGGSGMLVSPVTFVFDEETPRWGKLLDTLGLDKADYNTK